VGGCGDGATDEDIENTLKVRGGASAVALG
jgi:hypothetical protein